MAKEEISVSEEIFKEIGKQFGSDGLFTSDKAFEDVAITPSGSMALDDALGNWGLPMGRIVQFSGPESSGKTMMALMAIREWQSKDPKNWAVFIDAEHTFSFDWAADLGVDIAPSRLRLVKRNDAAYIVDFLCGVKDRDKSGNLKSKKTGLLEHIIAKGGAEKSGCGIVVLDSLAALQTPIEETSEAGKQNVAPMARFLATELRKLTPLLADAGATLIGINHLKMAIGQMFGDPYVNPGGKAWRYACSIMVNFAAIANKDSVIFDRHGTQIGHKIRAKIAKNKVAPPFRQCEFEIEYEKGVVGQHKEVADLAIKYEVIGRPNNVSYTFDEKILAKGRENLYKVMLDDAPLRNRLFALVQNAKADRRRPADSAAFRDDSGEGENWTDPDAVYGDE